MAVEFISWALEQDIPTGPKFTLVALANRANQDGECWPSQKDISAQTGQGQRSVRRHIEWLEEKGFIQKQQRRRKNGSYTSDRFTIQRPNLPAAKMTDGQKVQQPAATMAGPEPSLDIPNGISEPSPRARNGTPIPDWLSEIVWRDYESHRTQKKQSLTKIAEQRAIKKLDRLRTSGQDPTAVIEQSLENGWTGLFELKDEKNGNTGESRRTGNGKLTVAAAIEQANRELGIES